MSGFELSAQTSLSGLFIVAFLSATLLPGGSEVALIGLLYYSPQLTFQAISIATLGNTLGGMTSYGVGRFFPLRVKEDTQRLLQRYGYPALLLSWLPVIGDGLCVVAGWLRLHWLSVIILLAVGKLTRYLVIAGIFVELRKLF